MINVNTRCITALLLASSSCRDTNTFQISETARRISALKLSYCHDNSINLLTINLLRPLLDHFHNQALGKLYYLELQYNLNHYYKGYHNCTKNTKISVSFVRHSTEPVTLSSIRILNSNLLHRPHVCRVDNQAACKSFLKKLLYIPIR